MYIYILLHNMILLHFSEFGGDSLSCQMGCFHEKGDSEKDLPKERRV